ncbi:hypothetical protein PGB90_007030 [Kerria lacca]
MSRKNNDKTNNFIIEDWNDYMTAKKLKLEEQFINEAKLSKTKNNIFQGTSIFVNGYTIPSADEMRHLMMDYGGIYHHYYINGKTSFMIASNLPYAKIRQYKDKENSIKILKPAWITDSIKAGKMLDFKPYLLLSDFFKSQSKLNFNKINSAQTNECSSNNAPLYVSKSFVNENASSSSSTNTNDIPKSNHIFRESNNRKTASDENFLEEFYNNSRLHLISTLGATFKQYVNDLRLKPIDKFSGKERLQKWKIANSQTNYQPVDTCIMHVDMDCFFVSVGLRNRPELKNLPIVVTHAKKNKVLRNNSANRRAEFDLYQKKAKEKHKDDSDFKWWYSEIGETDSMSEIASSNYEARKFGIKNGMLLGQAFKLCPTLKTIPYDFEEYKKVSYALYNHITEYTLDIEAVSCDEMYVDCSSILSYAQVNVLEFGTFLRNEIQQITGCTCSTGFGPNKLIARLATKKAKPDNQYYVPRENIETFIREFNVSELPGVGRAITAKLANMGVKTCYDLQKISLSQLQAEFGHKIGLTLHQHSLGEDNKLLSFQHLRKSVSAEVNYGMRFQNWDEAKTFLQKLSVEVKTRLNAVEMNGKSITLKLMIRDENAPEETAKYLGHGVCDYITKTVTLPNAMADSDLIFKETSIIIQNLNINPSDIRGMGIQVSRLETKKNTSIKCGTMDAFVIKKQKMDIHPSYLEALPINIRKEVIANSKRHKKKKSNYTNIDNLENESTSADDFILFENNIPKLNPLIPPVEISEAICKWVSQESSPQDCDIQMISDYVKELILKKEFESELCYQENLLLGEYDICLSNVDSLYLYSGDKKRRLLPGHRVPEKVKILFVLCKNMKVLTFSFKFSPIGHGKTLTNALLHHAFPRRHQLLFAYDYREPYFKYNEKVVSFRDPEEWRREMDRTNCKGWRLTYQNQRFQLSSSLPEFFVVGKDISDFQINVAAQHFRCNRPPLWCWSNKSGAALVRMADVIPTVPDSRKQENAMLESVRKSHPRKTPPNVIDLTKDLPVPQNCKWLLYVSNCLSKAAEAADLLYKEITVVLQEWVVMGHPFCTRLRHIYNAEEDNQQDPNNPLILRSIWDWGEMFPDKDIDLFYNPLYVSSENCEYFIPLNVQPNISDLQLWSQCYFRFLPPLEIIGGGKPLLDLAARTALSSVNSSSDLVAFFRHIGSFYPFTHWRTQTKVPATSLLLNSSLNLNNSDTLLDTQSVMTVTDF